MPDTRNAGKGFKEFMEGVVREIIAEGAVTALRPPPTTVVVAAPGAAGTQAQVAAPEPAAGNQIVDLVAEAGFDLKRLAAEQLGPQARADLNAHFEARNSDAEAALEAFRALKGK